jgi:CRP/FNR family transcriptional regulator, cyclic AMP receptor protein
MFKKILGQAFGSPPPSVTDFQVSEFAGERLKALQGSKSADLASRLLCAPTALMQLSPEEARVVVGYMQPRLIDEGEVFIKEGDAENTDHMLLVLDGEVTVESITVSRVSPVTVTVLGPGSLIGEMGLLDGEPRSASCTASTRVRAAVLTRAALEQLMQEDPGVAAKLLLAVSLRIAQRQRDTADKLKLYTQLVAAMQQEIDRLMPT